MYKPTGFNSLSPYLIVEDLDAALAFIKAVFGAEPFFVHKRGDGTNAHVEVRIDDTVLMMGKGPGGPRAHLHVYVPDVDATFAKAKAAGGTVMDEPADKDDGDRRGGITDPAGTTWWFATGKDR